MVRLFTRQKHGRRDAEALLRGHRGGHVTDRVRCEHRIAVEQKNVFGARGKRSADTDVASARESGIGRRFNDPNAFE
jgi:hypothetical protein